MACYSSRLSRRLVARPGRVRVMTGVEELWHWYEGSGSKPASKTLRKSSEKTVCRRQHMVKPEINVEAYEADNDVFGMISKKRGRGEERCKIRQTWRWAK